MPTPRPKPKIVNPRSVRKQKHFVEVTPGEYFRVRKVDLGSLMMEGVLPAPMLTALVKIDELRSQVGDSDLAKMVGLISSKEFEGLIEIARRLAVAFVLEPKLTHSKKQARDNEDLLWVGGYSDIEGEDASHAESSEDVPSNQLFQIYQVLMGEAKVVVMNDADADEFRTDESPVDVAAVRDGDGPASATVDADPASNGEIPAAAGPVDTPELVGSADTR